ncbi:MAG: MarR family transcriptional regulator [Steroidobacteraceae bacterium]
MNPTPGDAETSRTLALAGELRRVLGKLSRRLREYSHPQDLTPTQMAVIGRLEREGPATATALARAERMRPQSMGACVAVLQAAGLVAGAPDPADGRQILLSLTPACRELIKDERSARQDWLVQALRQHLAPDEQARLTASVELLRRLADS